MPTYHVEMFEGRTIEQKRELVREITRISNEILGTKSEEVSVLFSEFKRENWALGGVLLSDG